MAIKRTSQNNCESLLDAFFGISRQLCKKDELIYSRLSHFHVDQLISEKSRRTYNFFLKFILHLHSMFVHTIINNTTRITSSDLMLDLFSPSLTLHCTQYDMMVDDTVLIVDYMLSLEKQLFFPRKRNYLYEAVN